MFDQIQGQDGYKVKSQSIIAIGNATDEAEYYFDVSQPITTPSCFVYVEYQNETQRESIEIHRTSLGGSRLHFYQYNRSNPSLRHGTDSFVQINSMASYWNTISKNVDNFGWIRQQANPGLKIKVYGGRINNPVLGDFDVASTSLTLSDNTISYIYFDDIDNSFKVSTIEPNMFFVLAKITTASGDITEILDYRASYTGGGIPTSITEAQRDALTGVRNGVQIYNTTAGKLQFYSTGAWYDVPVTGGENQVPRLTEIIEGKARWASTAEALAGTDIGADGASLVVKPSTIKSELLDRAGFVITSDYPLGEPVTDITKSCVFKETAPTFAQATTAQNVGDVAGNTRVSFPAIGTGVAGNSLKLSLAKVLSPSAFLRVRIETDGTYIIPAQPAVTAITGTYIASASSELSTSYAYKAFDNVTNTDGLVFNSQLGWLKIQLPSAVKIYKYILYPRTDNVNYATAWTFDGSNDGTNWTTLDTRTGISGWSTGAGKEYTCTYTTEYLYYRVNITAGTAGSNGGIAELKLFRYDNGVFCTNNMLGMLTANTTAGVSSQDAQAGIPEGIGYGPSGTLVDPNATKDIDPATLTTSLADTTVLMGATVANAHGVTLNVNETSQTVYKGVKFTLTQQVGAVSVDKVAGCTATKAYLYDLAGNLLTSATFSTNTATLNYNGLVNGQSYYIMAGSDGSSYTSVKQIGASVYPYTAGRLNYVGGMIGIVSTGGNYNTTSLGQGADGWIENSVSYGLKVLFKKSFILKGAHSINGYQIKIRDSAGTLIQTITDGDYNNNIIINPGIYRIEQSGDDSNGRYNDYLAGVATDNSDIQIITGSRNGVDYAALLNILSINIAPNYAESTDINNITSISTNDTILIPSGQKVHTVVSAVGDVVNASNYYKIGYSTNDTSTRGLRRFDGTNWKNILSTLVSDTLTDVTTNDPTTNARGVTITPSKDINISLIVKDAACTGTRGLVKDSTGAIITTGTFSGNNCVVDANLVKGTQYIIEVDNNGASYTSRLKTGGSTTNLVFTNGSQSGATIAQKYNIVSLSTQEITNPFPYISSTLFHNTVLSLTDSDFAYKVDLYGIATTIGAVGSYPKLYLPVDGAIVPNFTGMEDTASYYLSNVSGGINKNPGTQTKMIGKAFNTSKLFLTKIGAVLAGTTYTYCSLPTQRNCASTTYISCGKSVYIRSSGTYTIDFTVGGGGYSGTEANFGRIYVNGIAVGTERQTANQTTTAYTENIILKGGDVVEIYSKYSGAATYSFISNFTVKYTLSTETTNSPMTTNGVD